LDYETNFLFLQIFVKIYLSDFHGGIILNIPKDSTASKSPQRQLGEFLLAARLLDSKQLSEAIEYQCIYGGKLGTSLIELGLIDEEQLAKALSKQLKRHYIKPKLLMKVSSSVLSLIPKETALKYQAVPYHKDGQKLYVALNETGNLSAINDLSSQLNCTIVPLAIPEIRLMLALKMHYGMQLPPRYETIAGQINRRMEAAQKFAPKQSQTKKPHRAPYSEIETEPFTQDVSAWPLLGDTVYPPVEEEEQNHHYYDGSTHKEEIRTTSLFQKLADPQDREDIARAIISHLKTEFPECALLMVRKENATGWLAAVENGIKKFEHIDIALKENSVFGLVAASGSYYLGPMLDSRENHIILDFFSTALPQDVLVLPITVQKRLVSFLYIQGNFDVLEKRLAIFQNIVDKAEMSFKLLILKNKILSG
jgi:hypothetical protein